MADVYDRPETRLNYGKCSANKHPGINMLHIGSKYLLSEMGMSIVVKLENKLTTVDMQCNW